MTKGLKHDLLDCMLSNKGVRGEAFRSCKKMEMNHLEKSHDAHQWV